MTQAAFEAIYEKDDWGAGSGPGSHPYFTIEYRAFIQRFISMNGIGSIVDVGCGDWQFSRFMDFGAASYLGLDVVRPVVERNQQIYGSSRIRFDLMPSDLSTAPGGDLLLVKDVFQHLPDQDIFEMLKSVVPRFRFALITNSYEKIDTAQNIDLANHGAFRCLDLTAAPYHVKGAYVFEYWAQPWERIRTLLVQGH